MIKSLKIFLNIFDPTEPAGGVAVANCWTDPLMHPELAAMDQRALGDLPMPILPRPVMAADSAAVRQTQRKATGVAAKAARRCDRA